MFRSDLGVMLSISLISLTEYSIYQFNPNVEVSKSVKFLVMSRLSHGPVCISIAGLTKLFDRLGLHVFDNILAIEKRKIHIFEIPRAEIVGRNLNP